MSESLSRVQLLGPHELYSPWNSPGQNTGVGSLSLLQVAVPSSSGSSQPREWTQVACIAGKFFTNWTIREASCLMGDITVTKSEHYRVLHHLDVICQKEGRSGQNEKKGKNHCSFRVAWFYTCTLQGHLEIRGFHKASCKVDCNNP